MMGKKKADKNGRKPDTKAKQQSNLNSEEEWTKGVSAR